jgi:hypothetical protein
VRIGAPDGFGSAFLAPRRVALDQAGQAGGQEGAAEAVRRADPHRADELRGRDRLERRLSEKLFHRRASGYTATQAGLALVATADGIESARSIRRITVA